MIGLSFLACPDSQFLKHSGVQKIPPDPFRIQLENLSVSSSNGFVQPEHVRLIMTELVKKGLIDGSDLP